MTEVKENGASVASFGYDGDGEMVSASIGGVTTSYVGGYFEWQTTASGSVAVKYYSAGSAKTAMRKAEVVTYLLGDHLGSTSVVFDDSTNGIQRQGYRPFGEKRYPTDPNGSLPTDYQYTGQRGFEEIGLYFYNARWYDSALGRFTQADTIVPKPGNPMAWDRFAYVLNSPIRYSDPTGHRIDDGCGTEGCSLDNPSQSYVVVVETLVADPRSWDELPEGYKAILNQGGVTESVYARSNMAGNLTDRALAGNMDAIIQLVIPSHVGLRLQIELSFDFGIGVSGTLGINGLYNRNSNSLVGNVDWSGELGGGIGGGASETGGVLVGWGSSSVNDVVDGYSGIISGTAAAGSALSAALTVPLDKTGLHVDAYSGQIPVTLYIGAGGGGGYAAIGGGVNGPTGIVQNFSDILPWR